MTNILLFLTSSFIWGTTWYAITLQVNAASFEWAVSLRWILAATIILLFSLFKGVKLSYRPVDFLKISLLGLASYSVTYMLVYRAELYVVSGLVAIAYAASPLINMLMGRLLMRTPMSASVTAGGLLGLLGILAVFWPELSHMQTNEYFFSSCVCILFAILISAFGNIWVGYLGRRQLWGVGPLAISMTSGALLSTLIALISGVPFDVQWTPTFIGALAYLAIFGSILAFASYFALITRVGASKAGYVNVVSTAIALVISGLFENFQWQLLTYFGLALVIAGNIVAMKNTAPKNEGTRNEG